MTSDGWSLTPPEIGFEWAMSREGDSVVIHYGVENRGAETLWVVDRLVQPGPDGARRIERPIVRTSEVEGAALVVLGMVSPDTPVFYLPTPTFRPVPPGGRIDGDVSVAWPLASWHPVAAVDPLRSPRAIRFGIQGFFGEPDAWHTLTDVDGTTFATPEYSAGACWIWSDAKPLP